MNLSREDFDKVTQEFAQLTTLSQQKEFIKNHNLDIEFRDSKKSEQKSKVKEEKDNELQQDSK